MAHMRARMASSGRIAVMPCPVSMGRMHVKK